MKIQTTAQNKQAEKFYKKLQKKFSRKINLNLSRIKFAIKNEQIHIDQKLNQKVLNIIGSDGKNTVLQSLKTILIQNKNNVTSFTSPAIITPLDRIFLKNRYISLKNFKKFANNIISSKVNLTLFECLTLIYLKSIKNIKKIDYHLIEAGCGFNKDSTNLFEMPRAQIITNLNVQHKKLLKAKNINDICKIKCGALSKKTTIYIGKQKPETLKIIKKIAEEHKKKLQGKKLATFVSSYVKKISKGLSKR